MRLITKTELSRYKVNTLRALDSSGELQLENALNENLCSLQKLFKIIRTNSDDNAESTRTWIIFTKILLEVY